MKRFLLVALALAVAAAGCAARDGGSPTPTTATGSAPAMSNEQALDMLRAAAAALPDQYGFNLKATKAGQQLLTAEGAFDNATKAAYLTLRGDAAAFGGIDLFSQGVSIYTSSEGAAYFFPGVTVVQAASIEQLEGVVPAQLFDPDMVLDQVRDNVTIQSVQATTHRGQPAIEARITTSDEGRSAAGRVIMYQDPPRLAFLEATVPSSGEGPSSPFDGATMAVDVLYGGDAPEVPAKVARAMALGHTPSASGSGQTWTFARDGAVPLAEIEAQVRDFEGEGETAADKPVVVAMTLDEGTASGGGATLTFEDADGDGLVSAGDRLRMQTGGSGDVRPVLFLKDAQTGDLVTSDLMVVFEMIFGGF